MKRILKTLKWIGLSIGSLLLLITLAGLSLRLSTPRLQPTGELVDVGGFSLHIDGAGDRDDKPTLVIEGGSGMPSEYYHWLSEGLKDSIRVVRYDRAGIGFSDASDTPRTPEVIAHELHTLLKNSGESPPYILAGHSLGGPYIRVYTELYPDEVLAMFLLDSTHPDRAKRITSIPSPSSFMFKGMMALYDVQSILGDLGIMLLYDQLMGPIYNREADGLPDHINARTKEYLVDGKHLQTMGKEMAQYHHTLDRAGKLTDFGSLPIRVFSGEPREIPDKIYKKYLDRGMDLRDNQVKSMAMQSELAQLSTDARLTLLPGDHTSIFTKKSNADIICNEVMQVVEELGY